MTHEEHKEHHRRLHKALSELTADWIECVGFDSQKHFSNTTIMELIEWSFEQTKNPIESSL